MDYLLNPSYTFANFSVKPGNQFAFAVCQAVAYRPGGVYNPLFIYGDHGLGKTHLLHAIAHQCLALHASLNVFYVPAHTFINECIESTIKDNISEFRDKYKKKDMMVIDDIQSILANVRIQDEFFHTINYYILANKQLIATSDKSPREVIQIDERIRNCFEYGIIADMQAT
jgi:chromosomal replication initiator protein